MKDQGETRMVRIIGLILMILTLIATLLAAVPGFLSLREKKAAVFYEARHSEMLYIKGADENRIRALLEREGLPDALASVRVTNRGDVAAKEVNVSLKVPGVIIAHKTIPSADEIPAWLEIAQQPIEAKFPSRINFVFRKLCVEPVVQIEVSYRRIGEENPTWEIFADGIRAKEVASFHDLSLEQGDSWLRQSLTVLLLGLLLTITVVLILKIRKNPEMRTLFKRLMYNCLPFLIVAPSRHRPAFRDPVSRKWQCFKNDVLFQIAQKPGITLIRAADGDFLAERPEEFWDGIVEYKGVRFGLDVHTAEQRWAGIGGTREEQVHYFLHILSMANRASLVPLLLSDQNVWAEGNAMLAQEFLDNMDAKPAGQRIYTAFGTPDSLSESFDKIVQECVTHLETVLPSADIT